MILKDASLSAHYHMYIYYCLLSSFMPASLRIVHILLGNGSFWALDRDPPFFYCENVDIFYIFIGPFLFRAICYSTCHLGTFLNFFSVAVFRIYLSLCLALFSLSLLQLADLSGVLVTICRLSKGIVEYILYILQRTVSDNK